MTSVPSPPGVDLVERRALADDRVDQGFLRVSPPLPFSCACSDVRGVGGRARRREAARVEPSMGKSTWAEGEKKKKKKKKSNSSGGHKNAKTGASRQRVAKWLNGQAGKGDGGPAEA